MAKHALSAIEQNTVREEPAHYRLETPRLFKLIGIIRRAAGPGARRELGLSDFEWRVMAMVGDRAPLSLNELAGVSSHDKGQLSRGVKRLVQAGLLVRESRRGRRGVFISPTPAGRKVYQDLVQLAVRQNQRFVEDIPAEELKVFLRVIEKMESNALAMLAAEPCAREEPPAR